MSYYCLENRPSARSIFQNLIDLDIGSIEIKQIQICDSENDYTDLCTIAERNEGCTLGLAATYVPIDGSLRQVAIADAASVIVLNFKRDKNNECGRVQLSEGLEYLHTHVLRRETGFLCAFNLAPIALGLWSKTGFEMQHGVDLQSLQYAGASPNPNRRSPRDPCAMITFAVDGEKKLHRENIRQIFEDECYRTREGDPVAPLAQRAWVAHYVANLETMTHRITNVRKIDMDRVPPSMLQFCAKSTRDAFVLREELPREVTRAVRTSYNRETRQVDARANSYHDRICSGSNQRAHLQVTSPAGQYSIPVNPPTATRTGVRFQIGQDLMEGEVTHVTIIGRDDPSAAEVERARVILMILQGSRSNEGGGDPWINQIFFQPGNDFRWPESWSAGRTRIPFRAGSIPRPLNKLQIKAIDHMVREDDNSRITIIQGPPGTGKTTVIASYVLAAIRARKRGLWLVAKTNMALKNLGEKLLDFGLSHWKLLVSKGYHDIWHEHYYDSIRSHVITSENFEDKQAFLAQFTDCPVLLCTLDMLSVPKLKRLGVFREVPLQTIVVDEASQIEIGEYIPLLFNNSSIRKMTFIGDDKQLPPHGQGLDGDLETIFEIEHLKNCRIFLNVQYRMPPQIGNFISDAIYDGRLLSNDDHPLGKSLVGAPRKTCHFVNVLGVQVTQGKSWKNREESQAIVKLARLFQQQKKHFKILTPYAAQTSLIENQLRVAGLKWTDMCFNIDSFQGNEDDYIIISLVRSLEVGFLDDVRRTNVMLTRCKRGMVIFTSKPYMRQHGKQTLVGSLLKYYDHKNWLEVQEMLRTEFV